MSKSSVPEFRTAYDGAQPYYSALTGVDFSNDPGLTHQSFRDECDINAIIRNLDVSGFLSDNRNGRVPRYFDATLVTDYHAAMNEVAYANSLFADLPAEVRIRFRNDPAQFVEFFGDPKNQDEAIKLGLATRRDTTPERSHEAGVGGVSPAPAKGLKSSKKPVVRDSVTGGDQGDD